MGERSKGAREVGALGGGRYCGRPREPTVPPPCVPQGDRPTGCRDTWQSLGSLRPPRRRDRSRPGFPPALTGLQQPTRANHSSNWHRQDKRKGSSLAAGWEGTSFPEVLQVETWTNINNSGRKTAEKPCKPLGFSVAGLTRMERAVVPPVRCLARSRDNDVQGPLMKQSLKLRC